MKTSEIKIGPRFRKNPEDDLYTLTESIKDSVLIQPIAVNKEGRLIAGFRRLEAYKQLGVKDVPTYVIDVKDEKTIRRLERDENDNRKNWTWEEALEIEDYFREEEEKKAEERQREAGKTYGKGMIASGNFPQPIEEKGKTREKVSKGTGKSYKTTKKAREIQEAAKTDPKTYGKLWKELKDEPVKDKKVDPVHKEFKKKKAVQKLLTETPKIEIPENIDLRKGDFEDKTKDIPDNSIDLIFTDPPYTEKSLYLYGRLGELGQRVLKKGGSLVTFAGQHALPDIIKYLQDSGLKYWWVLCVKHTGAHSQMFQRGVFVYWKPLLWFVKGDKRAEGLDSMADYIDSEPPKKGLFEWAQSSVEAKHVISKLTVSDRQIVLDPFMGTGTTGVAAYHLNRKFIGIEKDAERFEIAKADIIANTRK